ncbi:MAG: FtsX-like permease family protein [Bacteroidota bacterium]
MLHKIGIVSVALGLSTALVAFLVMQGFQRNIEEKLTSFGGHLQVVKYSLNRTYEAPPLERRRLQGLLQAFPHTIRAVRGFAHKAVLLKATDEIEGVMCKGLEAEAYGDWQAYLTDGRLVDCKLQDYSREIVLSTHTASRLQVQVGDEVVAHAMQQPPRCRKLKVVGLYTTHMTELDEKLAFCDLRLIQRLNNWSQDLVGGYEVFLHDLCQTQATAAGLRDWLDYDLGVKTMQEEHTAIFDWLIILRQNVYVFMVLILLVASSNLASIVLIQMMERTPMIGLLKALGASNGKICGIMLENNLYMVGAGMWWGNLVGLGLCALQRYCKIFPLDPQYYYINYVPVVWDWGIVVRLNMLVLGVVTGALLISIALTIGLRPVRAIQQR